MPPGTYEEELPCGGKLRVSLTEFEIQYYFPGGKGLGKIVRVPGQDIGKYIVAFRKNFREFLELRQVTPSGGVFARVGLQDMRIFAGEFEGVCITDQNMPIATAEQLETVIASYKYARRRAQQVADVIRNLD